MVATNESSLSHGEERGAALLEFLIVFPMLILLFFATIEVSRGLAVANEAVVTSRQAATALFHECKDKHTADSIEYTQEKASKCLMQEVDSIHASLMRTTPNSGLIATLFKYKNGTVERFAGPYRSCPPTQSSDFNCAALGSQFARSGADAELVPLLQTTGWLVAVETYIEKSGTLERMLMPMLLEGQNYYSVAIL